jgi:hypothetical protein
LTWTLDQRPSPAALRLDVGPPGSLAIPFYFSAPFENRDVLIVYNLMLFAIVGLLIGALPIQGGELSPDLQRVLRIGIVAVAGLAVPVSLHALSAVI